MLARQFLIENVRPGILNEEKAQVLHHILSSRASWRVEEARLLAAQLVRAETTEEIESVKGIVHDRARFRALQATASQLEKAASYSFLNELLRRVAAKAPGSRLKVPPGYGLMRFLRFFCSRKFIERELQQVLDDGLHELYEAELAGDKKLARAIPWRLRGHILVTTVAGLAGWVLSKMRFNIGGKPE